MQQHGNFVRSGVIRDGVRQTRDHFTLSRLPTERDALPAGPIERIEHELQPWEKSCHELNTNQGTFSDSLLAYFPHWHIDTATGCERLQRDADSSPLRMP
jgi:hypothetical protein